MGAFRRTNFDFNPRSSCEERLFLLAVGHVVDISIHAPHARSDHPATIEITSKIINFNPRSSCEERPVLPAVQYSQKEFQSTLLMRGATQ